MDNSILKSSNSTKALKLILLKMNILDFSDEFKYESNALIFIINHNLILT